MPEHFVGHDGEQYDRDQVLMLCPVMGKMSVEEADVMFTLNALAEGDESALNSYLAEEATNKHTEPEVINRPPVKKAHEAAKLADATPPKEKITKAELSANARTAVEAPTKEKPNPKATTIHNEERAAFMRRVVTDEPESAKKQPSVKTKAIIHVNPKPKSAEHKPTPLRKSPVKRKSVVAPAVKTQLQAKPKLKATSPEKAITTKRPAPVRKVMPTISKQVEQPNIAKKPTAIRPVPEKRIQPRAIEPLKQPATLRVKPAPSPSEPASIRQPGIVLQFPKPPSFEQIDASEPVLGSEEFFDHFDDDAGQAPEYSFDDWDRRDGAEQLPTEIDEAHKPEEAVAAVAQSRLVVETVDVPRLSVTQAVSPEVSAEQLTPPRESSSEEESVEEVGAEQVEVANRLVGRLDTLYSQPKEVDAAEITDVDTTLPVYYKEMLGTLLTTMADVDTEGLAQRPQLLQEQGKPVQSDHFGTREYNRFLVVAQTASGYVHIAYAKLGRTALQAA
jgi:hypothetical protein